MLKRDRGDNASIARMATLSVVSPNFFADCESGAGRGVWNGPNDRGSRALIMAMGHLDAGVTPAQATADLNAIGSYLEKTYPKDERQMNFLFGRPGLLGDQFSRRWPLGSMFRCTRKPTQSAQISSVRRQSKLGIRQVSGRNWLTFTWNVVSMPVLQWRWLCS